MFSTLGLEIWGYKYLIHVQCNAIFFLSLTNIPVGLKQDEEHSLSLHFLSSYKSNLHVTWTGYSDINIFFFKILVSQQTLSAHRCYMFFFVTPSFSFSPKVLSFLLPLFSLLLLTLVWLKQSRDQNGPLVGFSASPFPLFYSLQPIR